MIQVHLWTPEVVDISESEQKIVTCLNDLAPSFSSFEIGTLKTHIRRTTFSSENLATQLDEALFIPTIRQLHIIILTDYDVIPLDPMRIIDDLVHIDSVARLTRRIQILVFDNLNTNSPIPKIFPPTIKEGIRTITRVINSKTFSGDAESWPHDNQFQNCSGCDALVRLSLVVVLLKFDSEILLAQT